MHLLSPIDENLDLVTKQYVDNKVAATGAGVSALGTVTSTACTSGGAWVVGITSSALNGGITLSAGKLTVPKTGLYATSATIQHNGTIAAGQRAFIEMVQNIFNQPISLRSNFGPGEDRISVAGLAWLNATEQIWWQFFQITGVTVTATAGVWYVKYLGDV